MNLKEISDYFRQQHYKIYEEALESKELTDDLDNVLVILSSSAFYDLDSIVCLLENKKHAGVDSLCRNILEKYIYMKFILQENKLSRARDFLLSNRKLVIEIFEKVKKLYPTMMTEKDLSYLEDFKVNFQNERYSNKDKYKWYAHKGNNSISKLFKSLDEELYGYYYMKYSGEIHANDAMMKFLTTTKVKSKNKPYDNSEVMHIALDSFSGLLAMIIDHYSLGDKFKTIEIEQNFSFKL